MIDIYFFDPKTDRFNVKEREYPKEWFRIRKKGNESFITYKKDIFEGDTWQYSDEEETEVGNFKICEEVIKKLGFEELVRIDNKKYTFENDKYEIVVEEVKGLGLFLEVERLNVKDNEEINKIKIEIQNFIDRIGINVSKELNLGKPELMLKKKLE